MTVIISPWSKVPQNGAKCAKNPPKQLWEEVVKTLKASGIKTIQIGVKGEDLIGADEIKFNLDFKDLLELLKSADTFISSDNFLQHFANYYGLSGIVLWSKSNPEIFGYSRNINLLKDKKYLRPGRDAWKWWNDCPYDENAFVSAEEVVSAVCNICKR